MNKYLVKVDLSNGESAKFYVTAVNAEDVMGIIRKEDWYKFNYKEVITFIKVSDIVKVTISPQKSEIEESSVKTVRTQNRW